MNNRKTVDVDLLIFVAREFKPREISVRVNINQSEAKIVKDALQKGKDLVSKWQKTHKFDVLNICVDFINYPEIE